MFERYIIMNESHILVGQNNQGMWYCKELPAKDTSDLERLIGEVNRILNKYNTEGKDRVLKTDTGGVREMKTI